MRAIASAAARLKWRGRLGDSRAARLRVLLAEPSSAVRAGLRRALENRGCSVCAEADDASSALEAALRERPDVCLLDPRLPGDGIATAEVITSQLPSTAVVMLVDSVNDDDLFASLQAGASGYLPKEIDPTRLAAALRRVPAGEAALPRSLVMRVIAELRDRERRRRLLALGHLTGRELEVLELLSDGLTTAEIAGRLFLAQVTVRTHVASILKKLGAPDREAAIRMLARPERETSRLR